MKLRTLGMIALSLVLGILAVGCGSEKSQEKQDLVFSKSQGPYSELFEKGVQPILEKKGYHIVGKDMSDLLQADIALNEGEVDFNVEQHTAYMENFNAKQGGHLVAITPIPTVPAGLYPGAKKSLAEIYDGARVAVPNDASNTARLRASPKSRLDQARPGKKFVYGDATGYRGESPSYPVHGDEIPHYPGRQG